jgi:hypothetical protein
MLHKLSSRIDLVDKDEEWNFKKSIVPFSSIQ